MIELTSYTKIRENIYNTQPYRIKSTKKQKPKKFTLFMRGVRQREFISPKLFTLPLEDILKKLNWEIKRLKVDGCYVSHLRFSGEVVVVTSGLEELNQMVQDLS